MNQILDFALVVIVISASGVMAPGPLLSAGIVYGMKESTKGGIKMSIGHAIVELPLIITLGIGVFSLEIIPEFRDSISILGALMLFVFAGIQIKTVLQGRKSEIMHQKHGAIIAGIIFSGLNPFFIIWWLTIGFKLISDAMIIWAFTGIIITFALHVWMDFTWLGVIAWLAKKSSKIISNKNYKILMLGLSTSLVYFGVTFLRDVF